MTLKLKAAVYRFSGSKGDVTRDDSKCRFLAQRSITTLLRHCFQCLQHCSTIATRCCAKNRRCESSRGLNITLRESGWG